MLDLTNRNDFKLILFDVGQWERIGLADTKALLWILGSISSLDRRVSLKEVALENLSKVSSLHLDSDSMNESEKKKLIKEKLNTSYVEAIQPFEDGTFPDQRQAYMLFLRACERNQIVLPKGAFAVAKMIDGMLSQKQQFNLHDVAEVWVDFLKEKFN